MKLYKIPYSNNFFITKNCQVYKLEVSNELVEIHPDIEELYAIEYKRYILKYHIW